MRLPRSDRSLLAVALAAALAVRVALAWNSSGLTMDSPLYVRMGEALMRGERLAGPAHHGYPLLVGLASRVVPGREWPGRAVSLVASLALVAIGYRLARRRSASPWPAFGVALALAAHPLLAAYGTAIMSEAAFLAVACGGLLLVERDRPRAGGALLGAAWWIRPEAVLVAPVAALLARGGARVRLTVLATALLVALPYVVVLRVEQGTWSLSPKTALVRAPFKNERAAEWRLADATAIPDTVGLATRLARDGGAMLRAYPRQLSEHAARILDSWPWPLLLLSAIGLVRRRTWGPALAPLTCTLVYPLLAAPTEVRFAHPAILPLAIAAAVGAEWVAARGAAWRLAAIVLGVAGLAWSWTGLAARRALHFNDGPMAPMRAAGTWLAANSAAHDVVMDRKAYVPFFAGRAHAQIPDEDLSTVIGYARSTGVRWIVVEEYVVATFRPQLRPLLDTPSLAHETRVRLAFSTRPARGEGVAVFEVVP